MHFFFQMDSSPLLLASERGYSRCVQKLLKYGADVHESDDASGYKSNCLMKAIENKHRYLCCIHFKSTPSMQG